MLFCQNIYFLANISYLLKRHIDFKRQLSLKILHELIEVILILHGASLPKLVVVELALLLFLEHLLLLLFLLDLFLDLVLLIVVEVVQHGLDERAVVVVIVLLILVSMISVVHCSSFFDHVGPFLLEEI